MLSIFQVVDQKPENKSLNETLRPKLGVKAGSNPGMALHQDSESLLLSEKGAITEPALAKGHSRSRTPWFRKSWFKSLSLWEEESDWSSLSGLSSSCTNQLCPGFAEGLGNLLSPGAVTVWAGQYWGGMGVLLMSNKFLYRTGSFQICVRQNPDLCRMATIFPLMSSALPHLEQIPSRQAWK